MDNPGAPPKRDDNVDNDAVSYAAPPSAAPAPPTPPPGDSRLHRWSKPLRYARNILLGLIALIVLAWLILYITKGRFLKHPFERTVAHFTHREVKVAGDFQLYFDPINIHFVAEGMTISNPSWATRPNLFEAKRIDTHIATLPLIIGERRVRWLGMVGGAADLEWSKDGKHNTWTFNEGPAKPFETPEIRQAIVAGTKLRYVDPRMQIAVDLAFQTIKAEDTRFENAIRFTGTGRARNTPFTLNGALLSPNATVAGGRNQLTLHADAVRTAIDVSGTLDAPTRLEGANLDVKVRGSNLADIFMVAGIAVPDTRRYALRSDFTKDGDTYRFNRLRGTFGDSDLAGALTVVNKEPRLKLDATLATRSLDIVDVGPFIGYKPEDAAKGKAGVIKQVGGTPRILPDAPLRIDALKNFDADVRYRVAVIKGRNIPVSNVDLTLSLDDRLLKLSPLTFDMAGGHLWSDIAINARQSLVHTDYDIRLSPTPMARLLAGYGVEESGTTGTLKARVKMSGDGNTVHDSLASANGRIAVVIPQGTMWARNIQLSELDIGTFIQKMFEKKLKEPVAINCGLVAFTVRNGIGAADPILIDTKKNVILGRGGFSFKTEAIDMAVRADGKKFSLFSAQSPIGVNGYFAKPGINVISPELLTRAGAGLGLGIFASPFAAVLAFIDVGDAKSAACGPVLAGANAAAQRTTKGKPRDDVGNGTTGKSESGKRSADEKREQARKFGR